MTGIAGLWHSTKLKFLAACTIALCAFSLTSCSSSSRKWELQEILTQCPRFNGGRLILGPDSNISHLEMELIRNRSGVRFFINLLFFVAPPSKEDPSRAKVEIRFNEEEEPWIVYPYLLEGGQRLLLPEEITEKFIQALSTDLSFTLKIGRCQLLVIPDDFMQCYEKLLALPIEEAQQENL